MGNPTSIKRRFIMFYFKDDSQITVYFADGNSAVWKSDNPQFEKVAQMCENNQWIPIQMLHNQAKTLLNNKVSIQGDKLVIEADTSDPVTKPEVLHIELGKADTSNPVVAFIKLLKEKGTIDTEIERIKPFLINMFKNPFINAVEEIYEYCLAKDFEITEDGCLLAYKNVRKDFSSIYDNGETKHAIGQITKVENFDTNRSRECSSGLHFCSKSYLSFYSGDVTIIVKINPMHICAIPKDYNFSKGRCTQYEMVGVMGKDGTLQTTNIEAATGQKTVKTTTQAKADKKLAQKKAKSGDRLTETADLMTRFNNDIKKVASQMNISEETVRRNLRKFNQKKKESS